MSETPSSKHVATQVARHQATVFLNGFYDRRHPRFYAHSCGAEVFIVCADGALGAFAWLRRSEPDVRPPAVVVGDFDSLDGDDRRMWEAEGVLFAHKPDQHQTDGQAAVARAIGSGSRAITIHGALPDPDAYDHDHFLGNLSLLTESVDPGLAVAFREPYEAVYACRTRLVIPRHGIGLNRVSILAHNGSARVARSEGLRWGLADCDLTATAPSLRNELLADAPHAHIELAPGAAPILVVHNWYEPDADAL